MMALEFITSWKKIQDAVTGQTGLNMNFWQIDAALANEKR